MIQPKKTQKIKPVKKNESTDSIFENVHRENEKADNNPQAVRISLDSKAKLHIGNLSRGGKDRCQKAKEADDHDMEIKAKLIPTGILEVKSGISTIFFGESCETSDYIVDCIEQWWENRKKEYLGINEVVINLDNGPAIRSCTTEFIKRMVIFSQKAQLKIRLIYYPPYHSKYNPVERLWGVLENYWNGTTLETIYSALQWAGNMTWKGIHPIVESIKKEYQRGVKVAKDDLESFRNFWTPSNSLPKWDIAIDARNMVY